MTMLFGNLDLAMPEATSGLLNYMNPPKKIHLGLIPFLAIATK